LLAQPKEYHLRIYQRDRPILKAEQ